LGQGLIARNARDIASEVVTKITKNGL
jgi:hypothetical protein